MRNIKLHFLFIVLIFKLSLITSYSEFFQTSLSIFLETIGFQNLKLCGGSLSKLDLSAKCYQLNPHQQLYSSAHNITSSGLTCHQLHLKLFHYEVDLTDFHIIHKPFKIMCIPYKLIKAATLYKMCLNIVNFNKSKIILEFP